MVIAPARFDGAVFDLDGVITDTARVHAKAWKQLFDKVLRERADRTGEPFVPFALDADYLQFVDGKARYDGVADFLASRNIVLPRGTPSDEPTVMTICGLGNRKDALFRQQLAEDGVVVFDGTLEFVDRLREAGLAVAVVSASRNCHAVLAAAGLLDRFDAILDGVEADNLRLPGKPDPALFLEATRRLGVTPQRALLVEDALAGVAAGRQGDFALVIGVDRHGTGDDLHRAGADVVVDDLSGFELNNERAGLSSSDAEGWTLTFEEPSAGGLESVHASLLAQSNGVLGTSGGIAGRSGGWRHLVLVAGAYGQGADGIVRPLPGPTWSALTPRGTTQSPPDPLRRTLDLRTGVIVREPLTGPGLRVTRFVSLARPGVVALRAECPDPNHPWPPDPLGPPVLDGGAALAAEHTFQSGAATDGETRWATTTSDRSAVTAVGRQHVEVNGAISTCERVAVYHHGSDPSPEAVAALDAAWTTGFDALLAEHTKAWGDRWASADIEIGGDPPSQQAVRFALFHLLSCAPTTGEAYVGARGLTGLAYAGHVFWDTDVFVLPALAAILPDAARSVLEYRLARLPAAREAAANMGLPGARFPWESADLGEDVTPRSVRDVDDRIVPIRTGDHEEHINSDIPWAAMQYVAWSGDDDFLRGPGRALVVETAAFWATRVRVDASGHGHIYGVIGPDEYHEIVDDNAFTNGMVRWHLRCAADLVEADDQATAARWRNLADTLVTGYDPATQRHEQFAGYSHLDPLLVADVAEPPVAIDLLLGRALVRRTQIIKQPDVLMLHHLIGSELPPDSLEADLDYYLPRTAHGSSLSPAICATLLARVGRPDAALDLFDIATGVDLDDLTGTTAGGLHLATMGGLWQAVALGFAGLEPTPRGLRVDPHLPGRWPHLSVHYRYGGTPMRITITHDELVIDADAPVRVVVSGTAVATPARFRRFGGDWRATR